MLPRLKAPHLVEAVQPTFIDFPAGNIFHLAARPGRSGRPGDAGPGRLFVAIEELLDQSVY